MAESYSSEESKRKAPGESKNKIVLDPAFRKFCIEYRARSEDSWREFDQALNDVPVSAESYLVMQALASGADISLQQILAAFEHGSSVSDLLSTTPVPLHRATVYRLHQRFQTNPETALADGRQGHPSKLRGEVRAWLEACCRATPDCTSCTVQTALSERFGVWVSIAHLNRVRATLGLSRRALGRGKKSAPPLR